MTNWLNLNKDLVQAIGEKLGSYTEYLRFRAVCVEWRSSLLKTPRVLQPQPFPYLLLPPSSEEEECCTNSLPHRRLLNPMDGNVVDHLELIEEARGRSDTLLFKGCSKGWLIAVENEGISIHLINTFPSAQDDHHCLLPPITTFPDVLEYWPDRVGEEFLLSSGAFGPTGFISNHKMSTFWHMSVYFIKKVVLSSPPTGTNCIAMAIYGEFCYLAYCKYGGERWTKVGGKTEERSYKDILFYQDKFFAVHCSGDVAVIVISNMDSSPTVVVTQIASPSQPLITRTLYLAVVDDVLLVLYRKVLDHFESESEDEDEDEDGDEDNDEDDDDDDNEDEDDDDDNEDDDDDNEDEDEEEEEFDISRFSYKTASFEILFKLDLHSLDLHSNKQGNWFTNMCGVLHNHVLFLGHNEALALSSKNFPGCKRNHIYVSDSNFDLHNFKVKTRGSDIGVFNIQNKTFQHRQLLWPAPVWVMHLNHP